MPTASKSYSTSSGATNISERSPSGLHWPNNLVDAFDYLHIEIKEFVKSSDVLYTPGGGLGTAAPYNFTDIQSRGKSNTIAHVLLPVPDNLQYTDQPTWNEDDVGVIGKMLPAMAKGLLDGDAGGTTDAVREAAGAGKISAIVAALGDKANVVTQNLAGKIANPYKEQVFKGIGMRQFDLSWKLVPRSKSEQDTIKKIIKTIRQYALPNLSGGEGGSGIDAIDTASDRWLTVPKTFTLRFKFKGTDITSLPKIKPCVCKNVQVSYTPDNVWATHLDKENRPAPVAYNLTLSFGETEIITGTDVEKGF